MVQIYNSHRSHGVKTPGIISTYTLLKTYMLSGKNGSLKLFFLSRGEFHVDEHNLVRAPCTSLLIVR